MTKAICQKITIRHQLHNFYHPCIRQYNHKMRSFQSRFANLIRRWRSLTSLTLWLGNGATHWWKLSSSLSPSSSSPSSPSSPSSSSSSTSSSTSSSSSSWPAWHVCAGLQTGVCVRSGEQQAEVFSCKWNQHSHHRLMHLENYFVIKDLPCGAFDFLAMFFNHHKYHK